MMATPGCQRGASQNSSLPRPLTLGPRPYPLLRELHIANLAVIEDIRLELDAGLNCFTGQTGAGKSLILGAFEILLGIFPLPPMIISDQSANRRYVVKIITCSSW